MNKEGQQTVNNLSEKAKLMAGWAFAFPLPT